MTTCGHCGREVELATKFCVHCGAALETSANDVGSRDASGGCGCGCGANGDGSCRRGGDSSVATVNDSFCGNLFLTIVCACTGFPFISLVGLVFSILTRRAKLAGDYAKATGRAAVAKTLFWAQLVFGAILMVVYLAIVTLAVVDYVSHSCVMSRYNADVDALRTRVSVDGHELIFDGENLTPDQARELADAYRKMLAKNQPASDDPESTDQPLREAEIAPPEVAHDPADVADPDALTIAEVVVEAPADDAVVVEDAESSEAEAHEAPADESAAPADPDALTIAEVVVVAPADDAVVVEDAESPEPEDHEAPADESAAPADPDALTIAEVVVEAPADDAVVVEEGETPESAAAPAN